MRSFKDYFAARTQVVAVDGATDELLVRLASGVVRRIKVARLLSTVVVSDDTVPAGTEIDATGKGPGILPITSTDDVESFVLEEKEARWFEPQADGGKLVNSSTLILPGGTDIVWSAGDRFLVEWVSTGVYRVANYTRASGVAVRSGRPIVRVVSFQSNIDIATALNDGDLLMGLALADGDWVLVTAQTDKSENGIWVVDDTPYRPPFFDNFEAFIGLEVYASPDGSYITSQWVCLSQSGGTIDVDDLVFDRSIGTSARQNNNELFGTFLWDGFQIAPPFGDGALSIQSGETIIGSIHTLFLMLNSSDKTLSLVDDAEISGTNTGDDTGQTRPIVAKTSDYSVVIGDDQTIFTNVGASGTVKFTLPANMDCIAGQTRFRFIRLEAQDVQVEPASGNIYGFNDSQGTPVNATNGSPTYASSNIGEWIEVLYMGSDVWHAELNGRWS